MKHRLHVLLLVAACSVAGCVYYPVPAEPQLTQQERFNRSWNAAGGALADEGVTITNQDRGAGVIRGMRGEVTIIATVQTLADGRIQVKFDSLGPKGSDAALVERISARYDGRMGR